MYEKLPSQETKIKNITESASGCKLEMKTVMEKAHFFFVIDSQSLILYRSQWAAAGRIQWPKAG